MNKKKNLLKLFTEDSTFNFHLVKTQEPDGHLIYLAKNSDGFTMDSLEFAPTKIVEELINDCEIKIEKFAPSVYFSEIVDTSELKYKLGEKLTENDNFSAFIESIKDKYRILEVKDSLLYKKDPKAYEEAKRKEHEELQKELFDDFIEHIKEQKKKKEEKLLSYDNNLVKLLNEQLESTIEFEKKDFKLNQVIENIISNLVDPETWVKVNDQPFICKNEIISIDNDRMNVFLTNNKISYTATLRFDKTNLICENAEKIEYSDEVPTFMFDYEVLTKLYDLKIDELYPEWEFKNNKERFELVIDTLVPIFKENKKRKHKEYLEKIKEEGEDIDVDALMQGYDDENNEHEENECDHHCCGHCSHDLEDSEDENDLEEDQEDDLNDEIDYDEGEGNISKAYNKNKLKPDDFYYDVYMPDQTNNFEPISVALVEINFWKKNHCWDDRLTSYSLPKNIINSLNRAGAHGDSELEEAVWEIVDPKLKNKIDVIESMSVEGFIYNPNIGKV